MIKYLNINIDTIYPKKIYFSKLKSMNSIGYNKYMPLGSDSSEFKIQPLRCFNNKQKLAKKLLTFLPTLNSTPRQLDFDFMQS